MGRLYGALSVLLLVFATAMCFFALSAHNDDWVWEVVGAGIFLFFVALGGLLVPASRKRIERRWQPAVAALMQAFGALCLTLLLTAAQIAWIKGNQTASANNAYEVLGLIIFLALLGGGLQGIMVTSVRFARAHAEVINEQRAERAAEHTEAGDGHGAPLAHA